MALKYNTRSAFICAVAYIESRKGNLEFRTWRTGDYYQPMGLQYEQYGKFAKMGLYLDDLRDNIEIGARAFAGITTMEDFKRRLKGDPSRNIPAYNATFDESYWHEICQAVAKYEKGVSL